MAEPRPTLLQMAVSLAQTVLANNPVDALVPQGTRKGDVEVVGEIISRFCLSIYVNLVKGVQEVKQGGDRPELKKEESGREPKKEELGKRTRK
mgnify:CR=1 FL=1